MDLVFDDATTAFRDEVRSFLEANVPATPLKSMDTAEGFEEHRQWEHTRRRRPRRRLLAQGTRRTRCIPARMGHLRGGVLPLGGARPRQPERHLLVGSHTVRACKCRAVGSHHATHGSCRRHLGPGLVRARIRFDLASLRSSAKKVDGGWLLNGQKTWSSRASYADWGFGLFRSDPDAQRHKGITYFMFDLRSKGVTVRPIDQLDGEPGFAEIFLEDVFVPDDPANPGESGVIGNVNEGWRVAMSTASNERGLSLRSPGRFLATVDRLLELYKSSGRTDDSALRNQVADAWIGARAYQLNTFGTVTRLADGGQLGAESSINKVFWSEWDIATHETALELQGPEAELADNWMDGYLFSLSGPIYAGTNEIQKNVIAERLLGLPKADR